jgi:hypothetical protein
MGGMMKIIDGLKVRQQHSWHAAWKGGIIRFVDNQQGKQHSWHG